MTYIKKIIFVSFVLIITAAVNSVIPFSIAFAVLADPLNNPGFEDQATAANKAYDWQDFGNGYTRSSTKRSGNYGIILENTNANQLSGAYQRIDLNQTSLKPVFIGGYVNGNNIEMRSGGYIGATLYAEIVMNDGSIAYWNSISNSGTFSWRWIGFNTGSISWINKPISHIFVVPLLGHATGKAYFDDLKVDEFGPSNQAVTIMIDDGEDNIYTAAKPVLDKYGLKASVAMVSGEVDNDGFLSKQQLQTLNASGWEIVSHSETHEDLTQMSLNNAREDLQESQQDLQGIVPNIRNFAYPYGAYNANLIAAGASRYRSMRAYELGDNPQGLFPYDVKVRSVVNTTSSGEVSSWLQQAKDNKRWEVLVFHGIRNSGDDQYYTTPKNFEAIVKTIVASGVQIVTYDQGINMFAVSQ